MQRQIDELQSELARRDLEQIELEGAVEFLENTTRRDHYVLGMVVKALSGFIDPWAHRMLYPNPGPSGRYGAADAMTWRRPTRRWAQFGSLAELRGVATSNGVKLTSDEKRNRQQLIRRLWRAWLLPSSVDLLTEKIEREKAAA